MPKPGTLPDHAQKIWDAAYAAAQKEYPDDTAKQHATAWAAIEKAGYKKDKDGKWSGPAKGKESSEPAEPKRTVVPVSESLEVEYDDSSERITLGGRAGQESYDCVVVEASDSEPKKRRTNVANGDYHVVFVESGHNAQKNRTYLKKSVANADPKMYAGLQMYQNHAAKEGEAEPEVRNLDELRAVSTDAWVGPGIRNAKEVAMHGMAHVFPGYPLRTAMEDPLYRKTVKLSHIASLSAIVGREANGQHRGRRHEIVESIDSVSGCDFVTKDGARAGIAESAKEDQVKFDDLTIEALESNCPELIKSIREQAIEAHKISAKESTAATEQATELTKLQTENTQLKSQIRTGEVGAVVTAVVSAPESGIPEAVRGEVATRVTERASALAPDIKGEALTGKVKEFVTAEGTYIAKATGRPDTTIKPGASAEAVADTSDGAALVGLARRVS